MALTARQFLIERAALRFSNENFASLRLEAGVPVPSDLRDYDRLVQSGACKSNTPYIIREPIGPHAALEAVAYEMDVKLSRASKEERDTIFKIERDAIFYYLGTTDNALERLCKEVHKAGMELLDIALGNDYIFGEAVQELTALAAARKVFNYTATQDELDLANTNEFVYWEAQDVGGRQAYVPSPTFCFLEFLRGYEEHSVGGVLPRNDKVRRGIGLKTKADWGIGKKTGSGLEVPAGWAWLPWEDAEEGMIVALAGTHDGQPVPYGKHTVVDPTRRILFNPTDKRTFTHLGEELLVPQKMQLIQETQAPMGPQDYLPLWRASE